MQVVIVKTVKKMLYRDMYWILNFMLFPLIVTCAVKLRHVSFLIYEYSTLLYDFSLSSFSLSNSLA